MTQAAAADNTDNVPEFIKRAKKIQQSWTTRQDAENAASPQPQPVRWLLSLSTATTSTLIIKPLHSSTLIVKPLYSHNQYVDC